MSEIQQTRYDQLLRRVAGLIGPGSKVGDVITELLPVIDVENMPGELLRLSGTRLCLGGGTLGATAGQPSVGILENPADSGVLVTLERVDFAATTTVTINYGVNNGLRAGTATLGTEQFRDTRDVSPEVPTANVRTADNGNFALLAAQARALTSTNWFLDPNNSVCVLAPGTSFEIGPSVANITIIFAFTWRERVAEQSELQF